MPPPGPGASAGTGIDLRALLAGNWVGSAIVAAVAVALSGLLGLVSALLLKPTDFGLSHTLDLGASIAAATFGAGFDFSGRDDGFQIDGSISVVPVTIAIIVLTVTAALFARMTRRYPRPGAALGDAARIAVMIGVGFAIPAAVFRGNNDELGRGWGSEVDARSAFPVDYSINVVGALFLPIFIVFALLALVVWCRAENWTPAVQRFRDWLVAPLLGYATLLVFLPLVGLIGFLLLGFGEPSLDEADDISGLRQLLTLVFLLLANGGVWIMSLGSGASVGTATEFTGERDEVDYQHLWQITEDEPGLWVSPLLLVMVLAAACLIVVKRSPTRRHVVGNLLVWVAGLFVVLPLMVRLANLHASLEFSGRNEFTGRLDYEGSAVAGASAVSTVFLVWTVALLVAIVVAFGSRSVDIAAVRARLGNLQQVPGRASTHPDGPPPPPPPTGNLGWSDPSDRPGDGARAETFAPPPARPSSAPPPPPVPPSPRAGPATGESPDRGEERDPPT